jgi:hypothetical protein
MATYKHLRSSTANKRPTTTIVDGQLAINTNTASPGLFFKDSAGTGIVKVGPVHVGTTAPNSVPASGGSSGNYTGEQWLDTSVSPAQMKVWNGSTWVGIVADELPVSKLQDGAARQLIQTDAAGTGVEWTSNVDVPGTLDVTSTATFDSIAQHPLGTAGAPTITFTGDTNTGIYSPGADQVAISTNGTGRLFVNSNGDIGVGTGSPVDYQVFGYGPTIEALGGRGGSFVTSSNSATVRGVYSADSNATLVNLKTVTNHPLAFGVNDTERMRLDSSGRLGLGTSSPGTTLDVNGAGTFNRVLNIAHSAGAGNSQINFTSGGAGAGGFQLGQALNSQNFFLYDSAANANRIFIDSSGRVGIGTTAPNRKLEVSGATVDNFIRIDTTGAFKSGIEFANGGTAFGQLYFNNVSPYDFSLLQQYSTGSVIFGTNNTERARIDSSGRLLVGTSSASNNLRLDQKFAVTSTGAGNYGGVNLTSYCGTGEDACSVLDFQRSRGTTDGSLTSVADGDNLGYLAWRGSDGTSFVNAAYIFAEVDGIPGANDMPGRLVFSTTADGASSPTERMRISNAGNVGINATPSTSYRLLAKTSSAIESALGTQGVTGDTATQSILVTKFDNDTTTAQNFIQFQVNNGGANCGRITANGANTAAFGSTSDIRLKENIEDLPPQLENILGLRPVEFDYIESEGGGHQIGFIAQEMQQIYPDVVNKRGEDDMLMITGWSKTEARLVKALQEAVAKIETLEAKVAALEGV